MPSMGSSTPEVQTLLTGIAFGESPRWHNDRLWFSDWGAQQVVAVDLEGNSEVIVRVRFPAFPMCIDWLSDGRLLIVSAREGRLLRREPDGALVPHADLSGLAGPGHPWNEIVVDGRGNAYINNQGFEFPGGTFAPGTIALLTPDGSARLVADGIAFPNGMAATPDNQTLIVAESYANKLTALRHRRRRQPVEPAGLGRPGRRRARRHLRGRGRRRLVRRRPQQAVRARPRRWPGAADDRPGPGLLRVHARGRRQANAVPSGHRVAWYRAHG
jgi:sugar lactone lactonase YvrE